MNLEFPFYLLLFFYTLRSCFYKEDDEKDIFNFIFVFAYLISVRLSGFDTDFHNYVGAFYNQVGVMITHPYYVKEWFYWILSNIIFDIVGNEYIVILLYDLLVLSLVIGIRRRLKLPHYFVGLYFLFFPSVFGVQNVFRQHIMIALLGYSLVLKGKFKKLLVYSLSVFTHNSAVLFFPLLFLSSDFFKNNRSKNVLASITSFLMIFIALPFFTQYKSPTSTAMEMEVLYVFLIGALVMGFYYLQGTKLRGYEINNFLIATYAILIIIYSTILTASTQAERIGMIILMLFLPFLINMLDKKIKQTSIARLCVCVFFTLPSLVFPATLKFLTTGF